MRSFGVRLVLYLLLPLVLLLPLAAAILYYVALLPIGHSMDRALDGVARTAAAGFRTIDEARQLRLRDAGDFDGGHLLIAVVGPGGQLLAGDPRLLGPVPSVPVGSTTVLDALADDYIRLAVRAVRCGEDVCEVRVGEPRAIRTRHERDVLFASIASCVVLVLLIGVAMRFGAVDGLAPVRELRTQMRRRRLDDLSPIHIADPPDELVPVVQGVNELLANLKRAAESHVAFVSNAAHQLRTPLARCLAQLEVAAAGPRSLEHDQQLIEDLHRSLEHMARLVHQLLALARSDLASRPAVEMTVVDIGPVVEEAARRWVPSALERGIDFGLNVRSAQLRGNPTLLAELVDNLIDNALRYGGRAVTVAAGPEGADVVVSVSDDGPGLPLDELEKVFERFRRSVAAPSGGTGVGLAIVRQIAELHGGSATLEPLQPHGVRAVARFPAFPAADG